jgi:hypothetical protein
MTYEEVNEIILRGNVDEWMPEDERLIYKGDLHLRIEMADDGRSATGEPFSEPWASILGGHPPTKQVYWIHYGSTRVAEVPTVSIDQRTHIPLPDAHDHSSMSAWNYGFGKIIEAYSAFRGIYSLDSVLERAEITVRGR